MAEEKSNIIRLTKADIKPAAQMLANAFQDYPEPVYFMPDETTRRKKQPYIYRLFLKGTIAYGKVFATSPKMEGVAIWQLVDGKHTAWRPRFSFGWWWLSLLTDKETKKRQRNYFEHAATVRKRVAPEQYWFLQVLGVDPAYQGQGFSSRLLRPMLEQAAKEGLPCYLETQLEKNVTLYEHFGFRVVDTGEIPGSSLYYWAMIKDAG
jgi:GNAT superfamily N-acetyltransferase